MANAVRTLLVKFDADTKDGEKGISGIKEKSEGLVHGFGGAKDAFVGMIGAMGVIGAAKGAWDLLSGTVSDFMDHAKEAQEVQAQTNAVLDSTKGIAGETAASLDKLTSSLTSTIPVDDQTAKSAENMLLTFTNIGAKGGVFDLATKSALDMATAFNNGAAPSADKVQQMSLQLGKALNDPITGVVALRREGVSLSQAQTDQVKHFMAVNDIADAQKVILGEVQKEFGKAGEAAGTTFSGKLTILQTKFNNVKETIGGFALEALGGLMDKLNPVIDSVGKWLPGALEYAQYWVDEKIMPAINRFGDWIVKDGLPLIEKLGGFIMTKVVPALISMVEWGQKHVLPVVETLGQVFMQNILPALENVWGAISTKLVPSLEKLWEKLEPVLVPVLKLVGWILQNVVGPALGFVIGLVAGFIDKLADLIGWVEKVLDKLGKMKDLVGNVVGGALSHLPHFATGGMMEETGLATVGEQGRELVLLPKGAQVMDHATTEQLLSGRGTARSGLQGIASSQLANGSGGMPGQARVSVQVDGHELVNILAPLMVDEIRRATGNRAA